MKSTEPRPGPRNPGDWGRWGPEDGAAEVGAIHSRLGLLFVFCVFSSSTEPFLLAQYGVEERGEGERRRACWSFHVGLQSPAGLSFPHSRLAPPRTAAGFSVQTDIGPGSARSLGSRRNYYTLSPGPRAVYATNIQRRVLEFEEMPPWPSPIMAFQAKFNKRCNLPKTDCDRRSLGRGGRALGRTSWGAPRTRSIFRAQGSQG